MHCLYVPKTSITLLICNVVLEKDGYDQLDRSCEKLSSIIYSQVGEEYPTYSNMKEGLLDWSQLA